LVVEFQIFTIWNCPLGLTVTPETVSFCPLRKDSAMQ
jgi:hypothetical protein